jgi:hypothetical protein
MPNTSKLRLTIPLAAFLLQPAQASVLFENNVLFHFQASGPVSLATGQNASVCATNLDNSPVSAVIALLQLDTRTLIASKQQMLQSGGGTCLNFAPGPNQQGGNLIGLVVPNAQLNDLGGIVQIGPSGGGCIAASLQVQAITINNIVGQTFLYVPMKDFNETGQPH